MINRIKKYPIFYIGAFVVLFFNQSRISDIGGEDNFKQYIYKLDEAHQQQFG